MQPVEHDGQLALHVAMLLVPVVRQTGKNLRNGLLPLWRVRLLD
jgi:hypothetical protein